MSKKLNLESMPIGELWQFHKRIIQLLSAKLTSEKRELEKRLAKLGQGSNIPRRKYPRVFPRYRNPDDPSETWSGRGKKPRWLAIALSKGRIIEEFRIADLKLDREGTDRAQV